MRLFKTLCQPLFHFIHDPVLHNNPAKPVTLIMRNCNPLIYIIKIEKLVYRTYRRAQGRPALGVLCAKMRA